MIDSNEEASMASARGLRFLIAALCIGSLLTTGGIIGVLQLLTGARPNYTLGPKIPQLKITTDC